MSLDLNNLEKISELKTILLGKLPNCNEITSIAPLTGGASRSMFKIVATGDSGQKSFVLRLSNQDEDISAAQLSLKQEVILSDIAIRENIPTPKVFFELEPSNGFGDGYVMAFLEGESLGGRISRSKKFIGARQVLTQQTAEALAKIHSIDIEKYDLAKSIPQYTPEFFVDTMYAIYVSSNLNVPLVEYTYKWLKNNLPQNYEKVLTHGDYRNGNFLVHPANGLICILDWEFGAITDPMKDLAYYCLMPWRYGVSHLEAGGFGSQNDFLNYYEKASGIKVNPERFKFWEVYSCFWWTIACMKMGLSYRGDESKFGDRIAIGRRHTEGLIDLINVLLPGPLNLEIPSLSNSSNNVANLDELIDSSLKDLMKVVPALKGQALFLTRVALSNLSIASREIKFGNIRNEKVIQKFNDLFNKDFENEETCNSYLCEAIKNNDLTISDEVLAQYLRLSIASQAMIDQPTYGGLQKAMMTQ